MLDPLGWLLLVVSSLASGLFSAYMLTLTAWSLRDWDEGPFSKLMVLCGVVVCVVSGTLSWALASKAYHWN